MALRKFAEVSLLAALIAVPLMYHLSLEADIVARIQAQFGERWQGFFMDQVYPYISGGLPVLDSKFSAWVVLGVGMMGAYVAARLMEGIFRRRFFIQSQHVAQESRRSMHRLVPLLVIAGYLIFGLLSFLFWPPQMPPEARAISGMQSPAALVEPGDPGVISGEESFFARLGGGGFFFSMTAWLQLAFALIFFVVCEDLIRERPFVYKILGIIVVVGVINALVVVLLKLDFTPLKNMWVRFSPEEFRNNLGAFIGHNTGVSSFLVPPLLIAITWLMGVQRFKSQQVRILLTVSVMLMLLAILLAQSRAIIPILILGIPALLYLMARKSALLPTSRIYIWLPVALVLVILTQVIPSRFNMLYRQDVTLVQRVGEFRPHRLMTETRLRILAVSLYELVPKSPNPLFGHSFGSFQYVYPKAQGTYFENYPRSRLAPTHLRTTQAHNEYLQVLVETGLIGLAAVLAGLFFLLRGGWKSFLRTLMPYHAGMQAGIFVSIVALLVHSLVDFPMRVQPIALLMIVLLAIWSAGDRLWLFSLKPLPGMDIEPIVREHEEFTDPLPQRPSLWRRAGLYAQAIFLGACAFLVSLWIVAISVPPYQAASSILLRSEALIAYYRQTMNPQLLDEAAADLWEARRIYWISGSINRTHGFMQYLRSHRAFQSAQRLAQNGREGDAERMAAFAESLANGAISDLNMALTDEQFHSLYQLRASVYEMLASNSTSQRRDRYTSQMMEDLYRAVHMNPGDPNTLLLLIRRLESGPVVDGSQIVHYLRTLSHFHPAFFRENVYARALDALGMMEIDEAYRQMKLIHEAAPEEDDLTMTFAVVSLQAGDVEKARQIADEYLKRRPSRIKKELAYGAEMIQVFIAITAGNDEWAYRRLQTLEQDAGGARTLVISLQYFLAQRLEMPEVDVVRLRQRLLTEGQRNPQNFQAIGDTALRYFNDYQEGAEWLQRRKEIERPLPMDLQGNVLLAKARAQLGQWDEVLELLPQIEAIAMEAPEYPKQLALAIARELRARAAAPGEEEP